MEHDYDKLVPAVNAVMKSCGYLQKGGYNEAQSYSFASDADVLSAITPQLVENGLAIFPTTCSMSVEPIGLSKKDTPMWRTDIVQGFRIVHSSGQFVDLQAAGSGTDSQDKGVYKAQTGAQKYMLKMLVMFASGDDAEYTSPSAKDDMAAAAKVAASAVHTERIGKMIDTGLKADVIAAYNEMKQIRGQLTDEDYANLVAKGQERKKKEDA